MDFRVFSKIQKVFKRQLLALIFGMGSIYCLACDAPNHDDVHLAYYGPKNHCSNSNDCSAGSCHPDLNICAVNLSTSEVLFARIVFKSSAHKPQLFKVPMVSNNHLQLLLKAPVTIKDISLDVKADILFTDVQNSLPNKDASVEIFRTYNGETTFELLPSTYDVTYRPMFTDADKNPMVHIGLIDVLPDGTLQREGVAYTISQPSAIDYEYEHFEVEAYYTNDIVEKSQVKDLHVQAFDSTTNRQISSASPVNCTPSSGQESCNNVSIPLPPKTNAIRLKFYKQLEPFHPTVIFDIPQANAAVNEDLVIQAFSKPIAVEGNVSVNPLSNGVMPPPRCRIHIEWVAASDQNNDNNTDNKNENNNELQLSYWVYTNENGRVERMEGATGIYLYPGYYKVTAYPVYDPVGNGAKHAATVMENLLLVTSEQSNITDNEDAQINNFSIVLQEKIEVTGQTTFDDASIPRVNLRASNIQDSQPYSRSISTISNDNGSFSLWVENKNYFYTAQAPADSAFAYGHDVLKVPQSKTFSFVAKLKIPFVVQGEVIVDRTNLLFQQLDLRSATIEWYKSFANQNYVVGRTTVNENGAFTALLPPN